jgi:hypothetical protein
MCIYAAGRQITRKRGNRVKIIVLFIWGRNSNYMYKFVSCNVTFHLKTKLERTIQIKLKVFCPILC